MDLLQFSDWLASTASSQAIQVTAWAIPAIQSVHILALSLLFAAALMIALRFAGRGLASEPLQALTLRFSRLIWWLLLALAASGILLIIAEPHRTLGNPVFYLKMLLLALVVLLTIWLRAVTRRLPETSRGIHRAAAALTVLLWVGVMFAGRYIAYYEAF